MKSSVHRFAVLNTRGRLTSRTVAPPSEMPSDLTPGEIVMIPDPKGRAQWYLFCDKQRFWANGRWNLSGTVVPFDPSQMTEQEVYEFRAKFLKICGWIG